MTVRKGEAREACARWLRGPWREGLRRVARAGTGGALLVAFLPILPALAGHPARGVAAQETAPERDRLTVTRLDGNGDETLTLARHRGFPALPWEVLAGLGWTLEAPGGPGAGYAATLEGAGTLTLRPDVPFVGLDGRWAQLVQPPYLRGDTLFAPLQLFTDVLPDRLPTRYRADASRSLAVLVAPPGQGTDKGTAAADAAAAGDAVTGTGVEPRVPPIPEPAPRPDPTRVVIIDAGHGGRDPGALGPGRTREKDVTLAVARALADVLAAEEDVEVHLTRDDDTLVPLWQRGEIATRLKGDRYGVFLSIHANSVTRRDIRGVETYFLSEARTEHEARVAALENSAVELERNGVGGPARDELGTIISELLNLDFQHWSSELAALTQAELAGMHPGPDRGVKQGPMAVLTNAMMPSVLVEIGFITNPDEEELLSREAFHREVAEAMARAVLEFFQRYPPGQTRRTDGA